ncbi:alpha/beta hydrolase fold domain-containing protein [Lysinibacillus sp. NPDC094403]|uniref:alpha/beta hydrolase fold domain-containing protein n=1 Tax=Lysinibacillus sp. NPDC094403 TaxID=3390581 RepID=UPI003D06B0EA
MDMGQLKQLTSWRPRGFIQWLLTVLAVVTFSFIFILTYYIWNPVGLPNIMSLLGAIALVMPTFLLSINVVVLILLGLAVWKKALIAWSILIPLVLLLSFLTVEPIIKMLNYAKNENVSISLSSHFFGKTEITSKFTQDVVYGTTPDGVELKLDVWPAHGDSKESLHPAVVKVHGGGWVSGNRGNTPNWNQWLSELGYTVFDVEYRMPPHAGWKDEVADVKSAIGWIAEHADAYNIDPEKINLMGDSAGGNLAMLAAYSMGDIKLPPSTNVPSVHVNSVINLYGPVDMTEFYKNDPSPDYVQSVMEQYIGGTPSQFPDRYKILSPISYIQENTPPTITLLGTSDRIVPEEQAEILNRKLKENNVPHELYLLPRADHVFDAVPDSLSAQFAYEKVKAFLQKNNK